MSIKVPGNLESVRVTNFGGFFPSVIAWMPFLMVLFILTFVYIERSIIETFRCLEETEMYWSERPQKGLWDWSICNIGFVSRN